MDEKPTSFRWTPHLSTILVGSFVTFLFLVLNVPGQRKSEIVAEYSHGWPFAYKTTWRNGDKGVIEAQRREGSWGPVYEKPPWMNFESWKIFQHKGRILFTALLFNMIFCGFFAVVAMLAAEFRRRHRKSFFQIRFIEIGAAILFVVLVVAFLPDFVGQKRDKSASGKLEELGVTVLASDIKVPESSKWKQPIWLQRLIGNMGVFYCRTHSARFTAEKFADYPQEEIAEIEQAIGDLTELKTLTFDSKTIRLFTQLNPTIQSKAETIRVMVSDWKDFERLEISESTKDHFTKARMIFWDQDALSPDLKQVATKKLKHDSLNSFLNLEVNRKKREEVERQNEILKRVRKKMEEDKRQKQKAKSAGE